MIDRKLAYFEVDGKAIEVLKLSLCSFDYKVKYYDGKHWTGKVLETEEMPQDWSFEGFKVAFDNVEVSNDGA